MPPPPAGFILDDARALPDAAQASLSGELRRFHESTGCTLWIVTSTYLSGESVRDRANALVDAWTPAGRGIVMAFDRSGDSHAMSPTESMWRTYATPSLVEAFREAGAVIQEKEQPLDRRLQDSARVLMRRITEAERERVLHNQLLPGHDLWAALVFLALLVAGALACALVLTFVRKRDAADAVRYFFPQADVGLRFGAPYGGGVMAEVRISGS